MDTDNLTWNFNYTSQNQGDPRTIAVSLDTYIKAQREKYKYQGPIDIYCHSMGALVSRYYMEYYGGAQNVRQWIGVAPVVHGAAFADNTASSNMWYGVFLGINQLFSGQLDVAANQLGTNSATVQDLEQSIRNGLPANVKYRVIAGYNPWENPDFFWPFLGLTLEKKGGIYQWTYTGDLIVALEQSRIAGKDIDILPVNPQAAQPHDLYNHIGLQKNPEVINLLWNYYNNPEQSSTNNYVPDLVLPFNRQLKPTIYPFSNLIKSAVFKCKMVKAVTVIVDVIDPLLPHASSGTGSLQGSLSGMMEIAITGPNGQVFTPNSSNTMDYQESATKISFTLYDYPEGEYEIALIPVNPPSEGYSGNLTVMGFGGTVGFGVFRSGTWYLDYTGDGTWNAGDKSYSFGKATDVPVSGDWNGDGKTEISAFRSGVWYVDYTGDGTWNAGDKSYRFGLATDKPVTGDWNGDGKTEIGVFRSGTWYLDYTGDGTWNTGDKTYSFGKATDKPVTGDWNKDGKTEIGVFRSGTWYLDYTGDGTWNAGDKTSSFGKSTDIPVSGDWNGDGKTEIGAFRSGTWYLDCTGDGGWNSGDKSYAFGKATDTPVSGGWS